MDRSVLVRRERPAERHWETEEIEESFTDAVDLCVDGRSVGPHQRSVERFRNVESRSGDEIVTIRERADFKRRQAAGGQPAVEHPSMHVQQLVRPRVRQRTEQHGVDGREYCGDGADADGEGGDGGHRDEAGLCQMPDGVAEVLRNTLQRMWDPDVANLIRGKCRVAQCDDCPSPRLSARESSLFELADLHLAMEGEFLFKIGFRAPAAQQVPQPAKQRSHVISQVARTL
jgi:hypothetical protein